MLRTLNAKGRDNIAADDEKDLSRKGIITCYTKQRRPERKMFKEKTKTNYSCCEIVAVFAYIFLILPNDKAR